MAERIARHVRRSNLIDGVHMRLMPQASVSLLTGNCMENTRDVIEGSARYNFTSPLMVGIANIANSLMFIKEMVFVQKRLPLEELVPALDGDFAGRDAILRMIDHFQIRCGNNPAEPAFEIVNFFCDESAKYRSTRGGTFRPGFWPVTANFSPGLGTAASPDGWRKGGQLSDSLFPNAGRDLSGLTASLRSVVRLPRSRTANGTVLNRHISRRMCRTAAGCTRVQP